MERAPSQQAIRTIQLSDRDRRKLVEQINQVTRTVASNNDRRSLRVEFNIGDLVVCVTHPNRLKATYSVVPRNLSRGGVAFIHGQFIYPGSRCEALLPALNKRWLEVAGKVVACRHLSGLMHEVCVAFTQQIDLELFVQLTAQQKARLEKEVEPGAAEPTAEGDGADGNPSAERSTEPRHAVIADDSASDAALTALWLSQLGYFVKPATDAKEAVGHVTDPGIEMVVLNLGIGGNRGLELIRQLRASGYMGSLLVVSPDGDATRRNAALDAGGSAFLEMPFSLNQLQQVIQQLRNGFGEGDKQGASPIYTSLAADPEMKPLVEAYVKRVGAMGTELRNALGRADHAGLLRLCRHLKGNGAAYGFEPVTAAARLAIASLEAQNRDLSAVKARVDELTDILARVRHA